MIWNIFQWQSLKTRVTIFTLAIFVSSIWTLAFYVSRTLRADIERQLSEQQFSTVSFIASDINQELNARLRALETIAAKLSPLMSGNAVALQTYLEALPLVPFLFNNGMLVVGLDGTTIADVPREAGRLGVNYMNRDFIVAALKDGKATISQPVMGKVLKAPLIGMVVPIRDGQGQVIGALDGVSALGESSFLDKVTSGKYGKTGSYLIIARQYRLIVTAGEKRFIMTPLLGVGAIPLIDRFVDGYEGSGILVNQLGEERLVSTKGIPLANWYVTVSLPTSEAFAPVRAMQQRVLLSTLLLTLLAGGLTWWMLRRELAPMSVAAKMLATQTKSSKPPQPLPIAKQDEVGVLIGGFNQLLEATAHREEALQESENRYHELFDKANEGLLIMSESGELFDVNQAFAEMHGYAIDELKRMDIGDLDVLKNRALEDRTDITSRIQAGEIVRFEVEHYHKDGHIFPISVTASRIRLGSQMYYLAFHQNITERKQKERDLQNGRHRLARAEMIAHVGNWSYEVADQAIEWSDELWNIFGRTPHSVELAYETFTSWIRDDFRAFHDTKMSQMLALRPGETVEDFIYCLVRPDGEERWAEVSLESEFDEEGKPLRFFGITTDITELKQAETEHARLEARLRESQKMEAMGTLAGGVAHDFNNALAMIAGNVELARQDVGPGHPALESLEEIAKASRRSKDLVQQILAFSRRQKVERKPSTLSLMVLESARLLRASLPAKVSLNVECKTDAPAVLADAAQVKQILLNLCSNAAQAVEAQERPGVIEVRLEACMVDEARGDLRPGRYACLTVRDNGSGMDEATRSHIFEPFFTTKPVGQGTGLGLSVVHGIAQAHEASIEVDSTLGEGTAFRLYFPAVEAPALDVLVPTPSTTSAQGKGKHILFVDDEEGLVFLMKRLLTRQGYRFSGYTDPREALAAVRASPELFDLVVTDYNMPHLSGLEVASALKAIRPDLPVVLASGYITEELRAKAPAAGIRELIYKPNTVDDLCEAVARYANAQTVRETSKPS